MVLVVRDRGSFSVVALVVLFVLVILGSVVRVVVRVVLLVLRRLLVVPRGGEW